MSSRCPGRTSGPNRISAAIPATGRTLYSRQAIAFHAASWPAASANSVLGKREICSGTRKWPLACFPGCSSVIRSTKEYALKCPDMGCAAALATAYSTRRRGLLRADDELAEGLGREQARDVRDFHGGDEAIRRNFREECAQALQAGLGHHALLLELSLGQIAARVLDDLAARNLDLESAFQPEHEIEEVDRLGIEPLDQRHVELDLIHVAPESIGDGLRHRRVDGLNLLFRGFSHSSHSILKPPSTYN